MSASSTLAKGLYYINWESDEAKQPGVNDNWYIAPVSLLVEVCEGDEETVAINLATIPTLYKGYTSIPIKVSLDQAPASDLTISLSFGAVSTGISVTPSLLVFEPDTDELYFEITVLASYDSIQASPALSLSLSGTDSSSYISPTIKTVTVSSALPSTTTATVKLTTSNQSGNQVTVTANSNQSGVLYWMLTCTGYEMPTFAEIKSLTADLVSPLSTTLSLNQQLQEYRLDRETDPDETQDDDVYEFFRRTWGEHCAKVWTSAQVAYASQSLTIDLDWLYSDTKYTLYVYLDNRVIRDTSTLQPVTVQFTTLATAKIYTHKMSFAGAVDKSLGTSIKNTLAKHMGINPE